MSAAATARTRVRLDHSTRRTQIVREATRLIAQSGFNAVTLADIADACDIRKPTVLHYFPTLPHLLEAVLEAYTQTLSEPLPEATPEASRAFCTKMIKRGVEERELVRLYYVLGAEALDKDHPAHRFIARRSARSRVDAAKFLAWKPNPASAAIELMAFWQGLQIEWLRDPKVQIEEIWSTFCEHFFRAD